MRRVAANGIPVVMPCRALKLARQTHCRWLRVPVTSGEIDQAHRANTLLDVHRDDPEFEYRLLADKGRWWSVFRKKRDKSGKMSGPAVHNDLWGLRLQECRVAVATYMLSETRPRVMATYSVSQDTDGEERIA